MEKEDEVGVNRRQDLEVHMLFKVEFPQKTASELSSSEI